jgi:transcriptional regulator with XRE-family HTH domain
MLTAEQLRAARAILQTDQSDLARASGVSVETIKRLERQSGKLHAKVETIAAIRKALEARHLEFLGDQEGRAVGVCLVYRDKLQVLRETLIREWTDMMSTWLHAQCARDPKFFEQDERRLTQTLIDQSARLLPTIVGRVLSELVKPAYSVVATEDVTAHSYQDWRAFVAEIPVSERQGLTTFRRKKEVCGCCARIARGMKNCKVGRI